MVTVFEQGDIVYLDFDPQASQEQRGRRPALVVSNNLFNHVSSLTMVCPITHTGKGERIHLVFMGPQLQLHITAHTLPSVSCSAGTAAGLDTALGGRGWVGADLASRLKDSIILFFSIV